LRGAPATKQSRGRVLWLLDCFAALAMTVELTQQSLRIAYAHSLKVLRGCRRLQFLFVSTRRSKPDWRKRRGSPSFRLRLSPTRLSRPSSPRGRRSARKLKPHWPTRKGRVHFRI